MAGDSRPVVRYPAVECALHEKRVAPAVELETGAFDAAAFGEAHEGVESGGGEVCSCIANHRDHLAEADCFAAGEEFGEQERANAEALCIGAI